MSTTTTPEAVPVGTARLAPGRRRHHASTCPASVVASWKPRSGIGRFPPGAHGKTGTSSLANSRATRGSGTPSPRRENTAATDEARRAVTSRAARTSRTPSIARPPSHRRPPLAGWPYDREVRREDRKARRTRNRDDDRQASRRTRRVPTGLPADPRPERREADEIGRASCRERGKRAEAAGGGRRERQIANGGA